MQQILKTTNNTTNILKNFADNVWEKFNKEGAMDKYKKEYFKIVRELLGVDQEQSKIVETKKQKIKKTKIKRKTKQTGKPTIPIPFYGFVVKDWCCGVKKNHGLYTQCPKPKCEGSKYCAVCLKQSKNNANGKPNCGDIEERKEQWSENLDFKPPGMKREVPYANIIEKLNLDMDIISREISKLGWDEIPECHMQIRKVRRGRPKTKIVVEDSDDECPKRGRGRPKKEPAKELTDEELIAQFMNGAS
tara:strand:+ start:288 stop:1028 length:741 start_codon:yes stop_codon:yes gene_type:complete